MIIETYKGADIMKKVILSCLTTLTVFTISACNNNGGEKSYNLTDFRAMISEKNFSPDVSKATARLATNGTIVFTINYKKVNLEDYWHGTYTDDRGQETYSSEVLEIKLFLKHLSYPSVLNKLEIDDLFKFYEGNGQYRIVSEFLIKGATTKTEYEFNLEGLCTFTHETISDSYGNVTSEKRIAYTYFK